MQWIAVSMAPSILLSQTSQSIQQCEHELLEAALRYTPMANQWNDQHVNADGIRMRGIVMEVRSSQRLFGGAKQLLSLIWGDMHSIGTHKSSAATCVCLAMANNATAAKWLVKQAPAENFNCFLAQQDYAESRLDALPVQALDCPASQHALLQQCGVFQMATLRQLPRDSIQKRFGRACLDELDAGYGLSHERTQAWQPRQIFEKEMEMPFHSNQADLIQAQCAELLADLEQWLKKHKSGTESLIFYFQSERLTLPLELRSAVLSDQARHWEMLLKHHFHRLEFDDDVLSIKLECDKAQSFPNTNLTLLPEPGSELQNWNLVRSQLQARLGDDVVLEPLTFADPRPEQSFAFQPQTTSRKSTRSTKSKADKPFTPEHLPNQRLASSAQRPLMLLETPARLQTTPEGKPKEWVLLEGPERIEFGWWSTSPCKRDYYRAQNKQREQAWVFQDLSATSNCWYLHGYFV